MSVGPAGAFVNLVSVGPAGAFGSLVSAGPAGASVSPVSAGPAGESVSLRGQLVHLSVCRASWCIFQSGVCWAS